MNAVVLKKSKRESKKGMTKLNKRFKKIPEFKSVQEEARFWDTHSPFDFPNEWKTVKVEVAKPLRHTFMASKSVKPLPIELSPTVLEKVQSLSEKMRLTPADLARVWITERVEQLAAK